MKGAFNLRVYGILTNSNEQVLLSDELRMGIKMTKFPGGGLEAGESLIDCLKREWMEELGVRIEVTNHFYTTDFYVKSAFNNSQLISIYYRVRLLENLAVEIAESAFAFKEEKEGAQIFRWAYIDSINERDLTFPIDKIVAKLLQEQL